MTPTDPSGLVPAQASSQAEVSGVTLGTASSQGKQSAQDNATLGGVKEKPQENFSRGEERMEEPRLIEYSEFKMWMVKIGVCVQCGEDDLELSEEGVCHVCRATPICKLIERCATLGGNRQ